MALKLGTENKTKTYLGIGGMIIALLLAIHFVYDNFISSPTPTVTVPVAPARPARTATNTPTESSASSRAGSVNESATPSAPFAHQAVALPSASSLDPTLHPEWMAQAEATTYTGNGRNIFSINSVPDVAAVKIEKPHGPIRPEAVVPQGPPPPPNIDLKFYGYYVRAGQRRVCLMHGESLFDAAEGDVVDRRYRVVKINPFSVDVEDLGYNHTQTLPLTQN
jgi:hypothetical protein